MLNKAAKSASAAASIRAAKAIIATAGGKKATAGDLRILAAEVVKLTSVALQEPADTVLASLKGFNPIGKRISGSADCKSESQLSALSEVVTNGNVPKIG